MDSPCGCQDAATCWDSCCCKTDQEKIAWARDNGVTPPDFLLARVGGPTQRASCCATKGRTPKNSRCLQQAPRAAAASAGGRAKTCCASRGTDRPTAPPERLEQTHGTPVLLSFALRCHGLGWNATLVLPALPGQPPTTVDLHFPWVGEAVSTVVFFSKRGDPPATPPPKSLRCGYLVGLLT
ncbi:hypothetical protein OAS39_04345 [Pirellulales bacterium]|nr:hypothetical protein [Pirellulales bacterium]